MGSHRCIIEELTPYFAKGPRSKEDYFAGELVNWSWGPNLYGVPFQSGGECFMINKDLFTQAGVEIPPPDWSYDDLLDISRKLTNEDDKQVGAGNLPELRLLHDGHVDVQLSAASSSTRPRTGRCMAPTRRLWKAPSSMLTWRSSTR